MVDNELDEHSDALSIHVFHFQYYRKYVHISFVPQQKICLDEAN